MKIKAKYAKTIITASHYWIQFMRAPGDGAANNGLVSEECRYTVQQVPRRRRGGARTRSCGPRRRMISATGKKKFWMEKVFFSLAVPRGCMASLPSLSSRHDCKFGERGPGGGQSGQTAACVNKQSLSEGSAVAPTCWPSISITAATGSPIALLWGLWNDQTSAHDRDSYMDGSHVQCEEPRWYRGNGAGTTGCDGGNVWRATSEQGSPSQT